MCVGVESGFAGVKFSGSIREKGISVKIEKNKKRNRSNLFVSFKEK